jgi:acyl-CoA synthetase (AMP-forming)/AMP-acid ligase II
MRMLFNAGQVLSERARVSGPLEALVDAATGERCDFARLNRNANRLANALLARRLRPGDRVGCLMTNGPRYAEAYFACAKAGHLFVTLNWRLTAAELSWQLADSGATAVLYDAPQAELVEALRAGFPGVQWLPADAGPFAGEVGSATDAEPPIVAGGADPLYMMYTSGTTGRPKGAVMSHAANLAWLACTVLAKDVRAGDRQVVVAPMFHIGGLGMVMTAIYRGMSSVLLRAFDPGVMWDTIARERITVFFAVPSMLAAMHQHPSRGRLDHSSLRSILCGAAPVPVALLEAYLDMGIEVLQIYGATETHGGICVLDAQHARRKIGSTGLPYFGIDVRVVDVDGRPVPPGVPGEVVTRGPHLISGYWQQPEATRSAIRDGWFHTGDIAEVDDEGFIYIKDRSKDMIISGGENVYPAEVEDALGRHPCVREVGVIGQPSDRWGESACAVIVKSPDWQGDDAALEQELRALAQARLAKFKQPKAYVFVDALPRSPSGKVLKRVLRDEFPGPAPE